MIDFIYMAIRRQVIRMSFLSERLAVYEGLNTVLTATAGTKIPVWSKVFSEWAARANERGHLVRFAYTEIARRLEAGHKLGPAMAPFVPPEESMIISAGEASGRLAPTFVGLLKSVRATKDMNQSVRAAYRDSFVTLISFIALSIVSGLSIWPDLLQALPAKFWDSWSIPMINGQIALAQNWWAMFGVVLVYAAYRWSLPNWTGKYRRYAEVLPFYASYRDKCAASVLIMIAGLLRANKTLDEALESISGQGTPYLRWHTRSMQRRAIQFAAEPVRMLNTGIFNPTILDRIHNSLGSSRDIAGAIEHVGSDSIDDVVRSVKTSATIGGYAIYSIIGLLLVYYSAVQTLGAQNATDRYVREIKAGQSQASVR